MLFADLLSLHLVTFLMFFILVIVDLVAMDFKITIVYPGGFIRVHHRRTLWDLETLQVI